MPRANHIADKSSDGAIVCHLCTNTMTTWPAKSIKGAINWSSGLTYFLAVGNGNGIMHVTLAKAYIIPRYRERSFRLPRTIAYFTRFRRSPAVWSQVRCTLHPRFSCLTTTDNRKQETTTRSCTLQRPCLLRIYLSPPAQAGCPKKHALLNHCSGIGSQHACATAIRQTTRL